ncbi:alpha/beta fold hydrolase [Aeromicrobium sp.]|uniref:alpha/beta fold hydrolase n=1 Tax=Aeromicrobium sp. TaxID=1871063 RepID=UPI003C4D4438
MSEQRISQFSTGGLTFGVIDSGPIHGDPVVLLHGFPQRPSSWNVVSEALHAHGLRTYALDQRGYSPGARPRSRFAYRITDLVSDVMALIERIGSPVHLVGHDWGAAVAWSVAANHPSSVRSLTAVSVPHPGAFIASLFSSAQILKSYYMALFQLPLLPEWLLSRPGGLGEKMLGAAGMTPSMIQTFRSEIIAAGALQGGLGYYRSLPLAGGGGFRRRVSVPTTYIWSDGDAALGRRCAELTQRFVTGPYELEVFEGVSHWVPDERPVELSASIARRIGL